MTVKSDVLRILDLHRGESLSGESIAEQLSVSRASVWKAVRSLKAEGYRIDAASRRGYRMDSESDLLYEEGIRHWLSKDSPVRDIVCLATVDSTNNRAKALALAGARHGTLVISDRQTAGRGRHGRSFFSPAGTGLYMSLILRPHVRLEHFQAVTIAAAVAVCKSIETLTSRRPCIKWVNDIFLGEDSSKRKICGILTEAVTDVESGTIESVVVGIGLNVSTRDFAPELQEIAGSLFPEEGVRRNRLAADIAERLMDCQERIGSPELIWEYRKRSLLLGRDIRYLQDGLECLGRALDVDMQGALIVRDAKKGETVVLRSGEVREVHPAY